MSHCHGCGNHDAHCECFRTNKVTHTPGPWGFVNGNQIRSRLHQIARVWMLRSGEGVANARLIAAAPELLAELKKISDGLDTLKCAAELRRQHALIEELTEAVQAFIAYDDSASQDGFEFMALYAKAVDASRAAIAKAETHQ